jgi:hypothetical protein
MMLKKRAALLATAVSLGALAAAGVAASPAGAAGVKAAGDRCTARNGGTCVLIAGSGGTITFVAHDQRGSTWEIRDATTGQVLNMGAGSASGADFSGWNANDEIELSITGPGSIKATWRPGVRMRA